MNFVTLLQKTDTSSLAQFYFADEELNLVAAELDSFDGRKDPERCTLLGEYAAELDSFDGRKDPERCTLLGEYAA